MLSQLNLRFHRKLIEALKNRAASEKTSVNALAERYLDAALQAPGQDDDYLRVITDPDDTLRQLYRKIILGEVLGRQAIRRAELRFMVETAHQAYRGGKSREYVRGAVLETLLRITFELLLWQVENGLPIDRHYLKSTFEFETEHWEVESARFLQELSPAVSPGYAEILLRPLAAGGFALTDFPDEVLARIFTTGRLQQIFPLLMHTRAWDVTQRKTFIQDMRPPIPAIHQTLTAGSLQLEIRVDGQRDSRVSSVEYRVPCLSLVVTGQHFVMPFEWSHFAELYRLLKVYRTVPEAIRRLSEGHHVSLSPPGAVSQEAILGLDALRVFVPAEAFAVLVVQLTDAVDTGPLALAVDALRTLYGDL
ncbi:transcriptional regulator [Serratia sp. MMO-24]